MKSAFVLVIIAALATPVFSKDKKGDGAAAPTPIAAGATAGKVVETMNAGSYTYVLVDTGNAKVWAAGPQAVVKVGDDVSFSEGAPMKNFHSKSLDRTFEVVYFVPAINVGGAAVVAANPHGGVPRAAAVEVGKIDRAAGGKTVAEVYADRAKLAGQQVVVRGKVVKYNGGILGRNWVHLQDGSGAAGTNDLTVTTNDTTAVGEVVTARGKVVINKDFGAGYRYDVLLEEASLAR